MIMRGVLRLQLGIVIAANAQRVVFFIVGSGWVGYWKKYQVAGRVRVR